MSKLSAITVLNADVNNSLSQLAGIHVNLSIFSGSNVFLSLYDIILGCDLVRLITSAHPICALLPVSYSSVPVSIILNVTLTSPKPFLCATQ